MVNCHYMKKTISQRQDFQGAVTKKRPSEADQDDQDDFQEVPLVLSKWTIRKPQKQQSAVQPDHDSQRQTALTTLEHEMANDPNVIAGIKARIQQQMLNDPTVIAEIRERIAELIATEQLVSDRFANANEVQQAQPTRKLVTEPADIIQILKTVGHGCLHRPRNFNGSTTVPWWIKRNCKHVHFCVTKNNQGHYNNSAFIAQVDDKTEIKLYMCNDSSHTVRILVGFTNEWQTMEILKNIGEDQADDK